MLKLDPQFSRVIHLIIRWYKVSVLK